LWLKWPGREVEFPHHLPTTYTPSWLSQKGFVFTACCAGVTKNRDDMAYNKNKASTEII
jgi:hypothetical protein